MFCLYNLGYGVFGIAEIYLTILCSGDIYWILHCLGEGGGTESGDTYQELMPVNVICHVLSLISRPLREVGSRRYRVGISGCG